METVALKFPTTFSFPEMERLDCVSPWVAEVYSISGVILILFCLKSIRALDLHMDFTPLLELIPLANISVGVSVEEMPS